MSYPNAVAVFCGSSPGNEAAFTHAAKSLGIAIANSGSDMVYGGGSKGIMGTVSGAALEAGAKVTGVVPYAMVKEERLTEIHKAINGDLKESKDAKFVVLNEHGWEHGREKVETILVNSMHERKVEMAKRVRGFCGLPGGFGTFEELLEVITWSQIGLHKKPVVLLNVLGFYNPLRNLIRSGVSTGFIEPQNEGLVVFIDGPSDPSAHAKFDWGTPALDAIDNWKRPGVDLGFDWTRKIGEKPGTRAALDAA